MTDQHSPFDQTVAGGNERLLFALEAAGVGTWEFDPVRQVVRWDDRCRALYGVPDAGNVVAYEAVLNGIHPDDRALVEAAVQQALDPESAGRYDIRFRTIGRGDGHLRWLHCKGKAYFNQPAVACRFSGIALDVTPEVLHQQQADRSAGQLRQSEVRFRTMVEQAPTAIGLLKGPTFVVELANDGLLTLWGKSASVIGRPLVDTISERNDQPFMNLLKRVYDTGEPFFGRGVLARLERQGKPEEAYFDFTYTPLRDENGSSTGIMVLATEVTAQVMARKAIEENEAKLRSLITAAPIAMGLLVGRDLLVEMPNQSFVAFMGKGTDLVGKPLRELMPESQPLLRQLDEVYTSGRPFERFNLPVSSEQHGRTGTHRFYNVTYTPLLDANGAVYALLNIATDVTEEVRARHKLEETEESLRGAIELAELGTWQIDLATGILTYSERLRAWFGIGKDWSLLPSSGPTRPSDPPTGTGSKRPFTTLLSRAATASTT